MKYEVEQKFYVDTFAPVEQALRRHGSRPGPPTTQVDTYFSHPARDFAVTDEALRLRRIGEVNRITYKGPKVDPTTKTRRELELDLPPGTAYAKAYEELLSVLGFNKVIEVHKERREASLRWDGRSVTVSLDAVSQLGAFVELELEADSDDVATARQVLATCAVELGLQRNERLSYCELLLHRTAR